MQHAIEHHLALADLGRATPLGSSHSSALKFHLRFEDLMALTGMKKSTLWAIQDPSASQYDPSFPPSYQLTARTKVWKAVEVLAWIESKLVVRGLGSESASSAGAKLGRVK